MSVTPGHNAAVSVRRRRPRAIELVSTQKGGHPMNATEKALVVVRMPWHTAGCLQILGGRR